MHLPYQHSNIYTFQHNLKTKSDSQIKTDHFIEKTSVPINYRESLDINKVAACYANRAICDCLSPICDYAGSWMIEVKLHPHPICGFCSTFRPFIFGWVLNWTDLYSEQEKAYISSSGTLLVKLKDWERKLPRGEKKEQCKVRQSKTVPTTEPITFF